MQYSNLGPSGLRVSRICLGMMTFGSPQWRPWVLDEAHARPIVRAAFDSGINFFDTADMYSNGESERITGRLLKELGPRDRYVVATKVYFPWDESQPAFDGGAVDPRVMGPNTRGLSRRRILECCDASLKRLGLDYIDLYQIHRWDYETPIDETMDALATLVRAGKVRYLGASSMWTWQFARAQSTADAIGGYRFISMQNHWNLIYREEEREMIPFCRDQGIGLIPWSPLARGFLAGNRDEKPTHAQATIRAQTDRQAQSWYFRAEDFEGVAALKSEAAKLNVPAARLAYAWLLNRGATSPIVGASRIEHLQDAVAAVDMTLDEAVMTMLEAGYKPRPVVGHR